MVDQTAFDMSETLGHSTQYATGGCVVYRWCQGYLLQVFERRISVFRFCDTLRLRPFRIQEFCSLLDALFGFVL